jgi:hypothetical protein
MPDAHSKQGNPMRTSSIAVIAAISLLLGVSIGFAAAKYKGAGIDVIRGKSDKDAGQALQRRPNEPGYYMRAAESLLAVPDR